MYLLCYCSSECYLMTVVLATPVLCMYVKMIVLPTSVPLAEAFAVYQHAGSFPQTLQEY